MTTQTEAMKLALDELVGVYCKAWEQSFTADNPYHTVCMAAEDSKHVEAGLKAVLAAQQGPVESRPCGITKGEQK